MGPSESGENWQWGLLPMGHAAGEGCGAQKRGRGIPSEGGTPRAIGIALMRERGASFLDGGRPICLGTLFREGGRP